MRTRGFCYEFYLCRKYYLIFGYRLNSILADNTFIKDFEYLLNEHIPIKTRLIGFPNSLENELQGSISMV